MGVSTSLDTNGKEGTVCNPPQSRHPPLKKVLSYIIPLCQPSFQLFQFAGKSGRCPDAGFGQGPAAICLSNATNGALQ